MNAIELADAVEPLVLTSFHETQYIGRKAADMLRRQHEAIQKLRGALNECISDVYLPDVYLPRMLRSQVLQALKDTEELA